MPHCHYLPVERDGFVHADSHARAFSPSDTPAKPHGPIFIILAHVRVLYNHALLLWAGTARSDISRYGRGHGTIEH